MKTKITMSLVALLALTGLGVALKPKLFPVDGPPPLPAQLPVADVQLLHVQPFTLETPTVHAYRAERPSYDAGVLLVLGVDPEVVQPRQTAEPVLYVGGQTAERLNAGTNSGRLVVLVPGAFDASAPIFFGTPELPERVDAATVARELDAARAAGIAAPAGAGSFATADTEPLPFENDHQLRVYASDLIELHAPDEVDLISGLRAPLLTR